MDSRLKRSSFSLLEILIALPLAGLLITTLLTSYTSLLTLNLKEKQTSFTLQESHYFRLRLKKMLLSLEPQKRQFNPIEKDLEFHYNNGVNKRPIASNEVLAYLVLKKNTLCLEVSKEVGDKNKKKKHFLREEELLSNVQNVDYEWGYLNGQKSAFQEEYLKKEAPLALKIKVTFLQKPKSKLVQKNYLFEL